MLWSDLHHLANSAKLLEIRCKTWTLSTKEWRRTKTTSLTLILSTQLMQGDLMARRQLKDKVQAHLRDLSLTTWTSPIIKGLCNQETDRELSYLIKTMIPTIQYTLSSSLDILIQIIKLKSQPDSKDHFRMMVTSQTPLTDQLTNWMHAAISKTLGSLRDTKTLLIKSMFHWMTH